MARKSRYQNIDFGQQLDTAAFNAGVYRRLSVEDGDDLEKNSIGNQQMIIVDYLKDKTDIRIQEIYTDHGYSGMSYNRPGFQKMMEDIKAGKINCVIVKDVSRLGRHFLMTSEYLEQIFPKMGVRLICVNDAYDSLVVQLQSNSLVLPFKLVINDSYAKDASKKIKSSIDAKISQKEFLPSASSIPYGYLRNEEKHTYDVDSEIAEVVVRIFEMRASGMKFNAIAKCLNQDQILSPGKLRYVRGMTQGEKYAEAVWCRTTIRKITSDIVYLGHREHGRIKTHLGTKKKAQEADEITVIYNAHPAIISQALFDRVQRVNEAELERLSQYKTHSTAPEDRDLLRKKIVCADCGSFLVALKGIGRDSKKTWLFYDCGNYKANKGCFGHYVQHKTIIDILSNLLDKQVEIAVDVERYIAEVKQMPQVKHYQSQLQHQLASVKIKRSSMGARLEQLLNDFVEGLIDGEEYRYSKEKYTTQYEMLLEEEKDLLSQTEAMEQAVLSTQKWLGLIKTYKKLPQINREILDALVEKIEVCADKRVIIHLNYKNLYEPMMNYLAKVPEVIENVH